MRPLAHEWELTGWWLLAVGAASFVVLRRHTIGVMFVAAPLLIAASAAVWVGRTFADRTPEQRRVIGGVMASSIAGAAVVATVLAAWGVI